MDSSDSETEESLLARIQMLTDRLAKKQQKRLRATRMVGNSSGTFKNTNETVIPDSPVCPKTPPRKVISEFSSPRKTPSSASKMPVSPARILLGVDKGLKAKDVSLKRPRPPDFSQGPSFAEKLEALKEQTKKSKETAVKVAQLMKSRHSSFKTAYHDFSNKLADKNSPNTATIGPNNGAVKEKYSSLRLSSVYLDEATVDDELADKQILTIPQLYAEVCPPDFRPLTYENYVVLGAVAKKSQVRENKLKSKYIVLTLTDLKYDIPFAIHGDAFDRYWKIQEGTVIAVLNPGIYVSGQQITDGPLAKSIGLTVTKGYDLILELGQAADLGRCPATTNKGAKCSNWINTQKATYCEFHVELGVRRTGSGRMEFNSTSTKVFSPRKNGQKMKFVQGGSVTAKNGLLADPYAPVADLHDGNTGRIYTAGAPPAFFDDGFDKPIQSNSDQLNRQKLLDHELMIRKKLSQRPNGHLLREYDAKGRPTGPLPTVEDPTAAVARTFTPHQVRLIGFDPTRRTETPKDTTIDKVDMSQTTLAGPPPAIDSDDDLEIV